MKKNHPLHRWLRKREWTQRELAEAVGITVPYLADILSERRTPSLYFAVRIWRVTGIRPERLLR